MRAQTNPTPSAPIPLQYPHIQNRNHGGRMDFSYRYTDEQEAFRARVSAWLDANAPADGAAALDSADGGDAAMADAARRLGAMGWLAPSEPPESGGGGLDADLAVPLLEELNRRSLLFLVDGEAQALRAALRRWKASDADRAALAMSLARGETTVWRQRFRVSPAKSGGGGVPTPDFDSVGVSSTPDADGYILNGEAAFVGVGRRPAILWTLALARRAPDSRGEPVCLLVDGAAQGVIYSAARTVAPSAPKTVRFEDVWALRSDALGSEGEGHLAISATVSPPDARADLPGWAETETDALLAYARATESGGKPLGADPIRARILVEAYIASRVARLLRMRAGWLSQPGAGADAEKAQTAAALSSLWRSRTATALSDAARQVIGPRALLSANDPAAADGGRFDRLSRRELAERDGEGGADRETIAANLRLDEAKS